MRSLIFAIILLPLPASAEFYYGVEFADSRRDTGAFENDAWSGGYFIAGVQGDIWDAKLNIGDEPRAAVSAGFPVGSVKIFFGLGLQKSEYKIQDTRSFACCERTIENPPGTFREFNSTKEETRNIKFSPDEKFVSVKIDFEHYYVEYLHGERRTEQFASTATEALFIDRAIDFDGFETININKSFKTTFKKIAIGFKF